MEGDAVDAGCTAQAKDGGDTAGIGNLLDASAARVGAMQSNRRGRTTMDRKVKGASRCNRGEDKKATGGGDGRDEPERILRRGVMGAMLSVVGPDSA